MTAAPQPPAPRQPLLLPRERRRQIVRWIGGGLAGCFFGALIGFPGAISSLLSAIPPWFMPFVGSVLFCLVTLFEFGEASSKVPAWWQLMLYAGAVLAGLAWTWAASLIANIWLSLFLFIVIVALLQLAAKELTKRSSPREA